VQAQLEQLEIQLIEQEHRILRILLNLVDHWSLPEPSDSSYELTKAKRRASFWALFYRFFNGPTVAAAGISVAAIAGLLVSCDTLKKFEEQNRLISLQLEQDSARNYWDRRGYLTSIIYDSREQCDDSQLLCGLDEPECVPAQKYCPPRASLATRKDAATSVLYLARDWNEVLDLSHARIPWFEVPEPLDLSGAWFTAADLRCADLRLANLSGAHFRHADLRAARLPADALDEIEWGSTLCPDGTNSDRADGSCSDHTTRMTSEVCTGRWRPPEGWSLESSPQ